MAKRLQEAEDLISQLNGKDNSSPSPIYTQVSAAQEDLGHRHAPLADLTNTNTPSAPCLPLEVPKNMPAHQTISAPILTSSKEPTREDLNVDEHGEIRYYGPTSAVHDPPPMDLPMSQAPRTHHAGLTSTRVDSTSSLAAQARESATWEEFALGNASLQTGIPREVLARLLHVHWTWISPMFMWVYRPAFIRTYLIMDMSGSGSVAACWPTALLKRLMLIYHMDLQVIWRLEDATTRSFY